MPPKVCNHCGFFNSYNTRYCKRCGQEILIVDDTNQSRQFQKVKKALSEKYIITEEIGKGGMAVVYKAIQRNLDRVVAIKVIKDELIDDQDTIQRFHEEARIAGGLSHQNIITIFDDGELSGIHYMVMEYLEGDDLYTMVKKAGILEEKIFKNYFIQIASALQYLKELNLVHRDIKSSNIFITNSGRPVLMDFGISSLKNRMNVIGNDSILGTPEYMSPEQINGHELDERSDLYSLGVVMYECFTGRIPLKGATYNETLQLILNQKPVVPQTINPKICKSTNNIILKLLSKQPELRFQSGEELIYAFQGRKPLKAAKRSTNDSLNRVLISLIISLAVIFVVSIYFVVSPGGSSANSRRIEVKKDTLPIPQVKMENTSAASHDKQMPVKVIHSKESTEGKYEKSQPTKEYESRSSAEDDSSIDQANTLIEDGKNSNSRDKVLEAKKILESASEYDQQSEYTRELIKYCDSIASTMPPN